MRVYLLENHTAFKTQAQEILKAEGVPAFGVLTASSLEEAFEQVQLPCHVLEVTGAQFQVQDLLTVFRAQVPRYERVRPIQFTFPWGKVYSLYANMNRTDQLKLWYQREELKIHPDVTFYYLGSKYEYASRSWLFPVVRVNPAPNGIFAAHKLLAALCPTKAFAVVDEDNHLIEVPRLPEIIRHTLIYHSLNPYNNLEYGHGGLKVFLRSSFYKWDSIPQDVDMTETVSEELEVIPQTVSIHHFGTTPYKAWRGAFREVYKLKKKTDSESQARLKVWCTLQGPFPLQRALHQGAVEALEYAHFPINDETQLYRAYLAKRPPDGTHKL